MRIELRQTTRKKWRFDLVATNGQVIMASKPYTNQRNANDAVKLVQKKVGNCPVKVLA